MKRVLLFLAFLFIIQVGLAQGKKAKKDKNQSKASPAYQEDFETRVAKKTKNSRSKKYNSREAFYDRLEANSKEQLKNEKKGLDPRYSDPSHFGHKKPPKKRALHKMKYCKVCGIRH